MIDARVVLDSVGPSGVRITTFLLTYPRFIHSEFMTHRMLSRNAASSRAIPLKRTIQAVMEEPAMPTAFTRNQRGMQAEGVIEDQDGARRIWLQARDHAVEAARALEALGVHKQHANRLLEPFMHMTTLATATYWDNFFALRYHEKAQPEFHELAKAMWSARECSEPRYLASGEWHLPFIRPEEEEEDIEVLIRKSVARCARTSYLNQESQVPTAEEDDLLYHRLVGEQPVHASPAEHQAQSYWDPDHRSGNFHGWIQFRKTLAGENVLDVEAFWKELE